MAWKTVCCLYRISVLQVNQQKVLNIQRALLSSTTTASKLVSDGKKHDELLVGEKVGRNLELIRCNTHKQPALLLLFSWLEARRKHLNEYFRFYLDNGFDVLHVSTRAKDVLLPSVGSQVVARGVLDFVNSSPHSDLMLHSMSVGGYQWGECLVAMERNSKMYGEVAQRLRAQVFDSVVDIGGIPRGLPRALSRNVAVHIAGEIGLRTYMLLAYPFATRHYAASSDAFVNRPHRAPVCYFNSKADKIGSVQRDEEVIATWRSQNMDVRLTTFDGSKHVQHHGTYPELYREELQALIRRTIPRLGLDKEQSPSAQSQTRPVPHPVELHQRNAMSAQPPMRT